MAYTRLEATEARRVESENQLVGKTNKTSGVLSREDTLRTLGGWCSVPGMLVQQRRVETTCLSGGRI